MKRPFQQGQILVVTPARLGRRGWAEGEVDGWRVRVRGGLPGEAARVRIVHVSKGGPVAGAHFLAPATAPHPARRPAPCPIHDQCGGCGLQHMTENAALDAKMRQARDLFPAAVAWRDPIRSPRAFGYRAKTFVLPQPRGRRLVLGARPPHGDRLVDTSGCNVLRSELEALAARTRARLADRADLAGSLRSVLLRCTRAGRTQATFVHSGEPPELPVAGLADAVFLQRHDEPGNRICSDRKETLVSGDSPVVETFGETAAEVPPTAFCQANPEVAAALYAAAAAALEGPRVAELYCGGGVAGLAALRLDPQATLVAVDRSPRAIDAARSNARRNGLEERCRFVAADAAEAAAAWDSALVNPPRAGCAAEVLDAVARSGARRLVYLSCNAATLARDAGRLGWRLDWIRPADMFPQTPHLELLACFSRA